MDDEGPSFTIYQDPPDDPQSSTHLPPLPIQHSTRPALAEIRLLSWGTDVQCDSALKHEMLLPQPETEPSSSSSSSSTSSSSSSWSSSSSSSSSSSDNLPCAQSEESKENIDSRPVDAQPLKTPPRKLISPTLNRTTPVYIIKTPPSAPPILPLRI
ncbi:hypothetical protein PCASD_21242 [Puccinia coronata f. sp. avenae]|uniref:Uncharacterized protein n=1 Tax=Puccinia coronata f. sp. avenae TaxID=200324 RepID=A0A2N5TNM6_9BASI|nr:hypothetical protein PCASD_21242 [Puccinia coronata f. sp. avenae]